MRIRWLESVRGIWCLAGIVLVALFIAGSAGWMGVNMARACRQREARQILESAGGIVTYHWQDDYVESPYPRWLESVLGEDFFGRIDVVLVLDRPIPHQVAEELAMLHDLESLNLNHSTIADQELINIANLRKLRHLDLGRTGISDLGLEHITCLHALERLKLDETNITDTGLRQLGSLERLKVLDLCGTRVTDAGILHLRNLLSLQELELYNTEVTSTGVAALKKAIPRLHVGENTGGEIEGSSMAVRP